MSSPLISRAAIVAAVGIALLPACTGAAVQAPQTTLEESELTPVVLPEIVAAPSKPAEVDVDTSTFYVSPVIGNDDNDGQTPAQPFASLQGAVNRLEPGHTLYLMSGLYDDTSEPGNAHYVIDNSGTAQEWITVTAAPGEEPVVMANDGNAVVIRGDYVEVSELRIRGEGFSVENPYGWGILIRDSHHVRVAHNRISDMAVGGITSVQSSNMEILYNEVFDNSFWGSEQGSGISFWKSIDRGFGPAADGYHDRIVGNTVYRNENRVFSRWREDEQTITDGNGIIVDSAPDYLGKTLVANNVIFDNGGRAVLVLDASWVDIMFNTTYQNGRTAGLEGGPVEIAAGRATEIRVLNNLIWPRDGVATVVVDQSAEVEMGGNLLITDSGRGLSTELDLVIASDPALVAPGVDPATADFRPTATSPAVGRAIATDPTVEVDVDGNHRPATAGSAGAYEIKEG